MAHFGQVVVADVQLNAFGLRLYSLIGQLSFTDKQKRDLRKGTGILISPNLVLTANFNILNTQTCDLFENIKFYLGNDNSEKRAYDIEDVYVPDRTFINRKKTIFAYGLLKLKEKVNATDFIPLNADSKNIGQGPRLGLFGYPLDR